MAVGSFSFADAANVYVQNDHSTDLGIGAQTVKFVPIATSTPGGMGINASLVAVSLYIRQPGGANATMSITCFTDIALSDDCDEFAEATSTTAVTASTNGEAHLTIFSTFPDRTFTPERYYVFTVTGAGAFLNLWGILGPTYCAIGGEKLCNGYPYFEIGGGINWDAIYFPAIYDINAPAIAASSSMWSQYTATDTLLEIGSSCAEDGNIFARAMCSAGAYLFTPDPSILNLWIGLPDQSKEKFPFSVIEETKQAFIDDAASSTDNLISSRINLQATGVGSTTSFGNILPNFDYFSTTTLMAYMPSGTWTALQTLMAGGFWLASAGHIYATVRRRHAHV